MPPTLSSLFDPGALAIVVAGTVLATVARTGWRDFGEALRSAGGLLRRGFSSEANRKALAQAVSAIQRDGPRRADPMLPPDRALGLMLETYLRHGALEPLASIRRAERALDEARRVNAAQVFGWAGELAPVFGLIGTLYGFTQLTPHPDAAATTTIMAAISTAVLTSLYGALIAHLVCYPVASAIERRGNDDEREREALADWFVAQIERNPAQGPRPHLRGVA
ncbi:MotA/TolQ/ExbB proton channel family protein [Erythrobacter colymbi]|uniref:MotA/TolQ/ExbB proton channel family protein n=1 Tax=Erythrobacter colymbi TaxID=1161202 RepID=UPI000A39EF94|nr:MotA/TolQ/ExbB proton channel family protein [Erythrobacter colymbi]